jgi:ribosomal protein S18 acetylase RimI-like enzyme
LYAALGFEETGRRPQYYQNPDEAAIVMRKQSC